VNLREDAIVGQVDDWITLEFAPHRLAETIRDLAAAPQPDVTRDANGDDETARKIAACDGKLVQYRAALDAGANSATVAAWIAETEAERSTYELAMRRYEPRPRRMAESEIKAIVDKLADIARVLHEADPDDKGEIFRQLGLKLTYHPGRRLVQASVAPVGHGFFDGVRGGT
jgi:site-specific DNA recombinase